MPDLPEKPDAADTADHVPARPDTPTASEIGSHASGAPAPPAPIETPEHIGTYRVLQRLGEGGFGVVYLAEQTEPVRRRVALKVIKPGMDTAQVVARFTAERQALAMMDHPNIAKVFDAGATETGRPYFVMEHVAGVPISEHADRQRLTIEERLRLFVVVCEAIQHAHQKGVIHRDIKPSNILVAAKDGRGEPKVIDFGVAKALHQPLTEHSVFTQQGQLIGTTSYMSPEQAEMTAQDIDTRADIYSLGVVLYELLTGARPISPETLHKATIAEIQRIVREEEPPKPSTRLVSLGGDSAVFARHRGVDSKTLAHELRGDLDWIVMKCLEKDRSRRYETASGLAADIRRHLENRPVEAGPPSASYRIGKFVRRNRIGVTAAALVVLAMLAGITGTTWGLLRAIDARDAEREATEAAREQAQIAANAKDEAQQRADELEQVVAFQAAQLRGIDVELMATRLREDLIAEARTAMERASVNGSTVDVRVQQLATLLADANMTNVALRTLDRNIFDRALAAVDEQFADDPVIRARLLQSIVFTLETVGLVDEAIEPLTEAIEIRRRELGDDHPDTLLSINAMGILLWREGKYAEAEPFYREALEGRRRVLGNDHPDTLSSADNVGIVLWAQGRMAEAEPFLLEAYEGLRRVLGDDHRDTLLALNNMAFVLEGQGRYADAEQHFRQSLDGFKRALGDEDPYTLRALTSMSGILWTQGRLAEAEPYNREALVVRRRVLGDDHPDTLQSIDNMGLLLIGQGRLDEAEPYVREALEKRRRLFGDDHPHTLRSIDNTGYLLKTQGRLAEAEPYIREALEGRRRVLGEAHPLTLWSVNSLGIVLATQGRVAEAEPYLVQAFDGRRQTLGDDHPDTRISANTLALLMITQGQFAETEQLLREQLPINERALGNDHPRTAEARGLLGEAIAGQERFAEAEALLLDSHLTLHVESPEGERIMMLMQSIDRLARLYEAWGEAEEAARWRERLGGGADDAASIDD